MGGYNEADEGSGDSGVMTGPSKDSMKKLDQIIQVGSHGKPETTHTDDCATELPHESCHSNITVAHIIACHYFKRWDQESQ